jgi:hypothetical protein
MQTTQGSTKTGMDSVERAPIALFLFNRPHLTSQVYERVRAVRPSRLLVVADGPRASRPEDRTLCEAARKIVSSPDWPCELLTNFAEENLGNRGRLSSGLNWVFDQCPEAIILEDDCLPCPSFFSFCSQMLSRYREDNRIMHVSGQNLQGGMRRGNGSYFFSRYSLSWGWASWRRAWQYYDVGLSAWPIARQEGWLASILDDPLEIEYWTGIFDKTYGGLINTWDYQWLFTCWCQNGLSIQPNENLVSNIGVGPDATNFKEGHRTLGIPTRELSECVHSTAIFQHREADRFTFKEYIASPKIPWLQKMRSRLALRTRLKRLLRYSSSASDGMAKCGSDGSS